MVIKVSSTIFVLILIKHPIRRSYPVNTVFRMDTVTARVGHSYSEGLRPFCLVPRKVKFVRLHERHPYYSSYVLDKVDMIEIATSGTSMSARYRDREIT